MQLRQTRASGKGLNIDFFKVFHQRTGTIIRESDAFVEGIITDFHNTCHSTKLTGERRTILESTLSDGFQRCFIIECQLAQIRIVDKGCITDVLHILWNRHRLQAISRPAIDLNASRPSERTVSDGLVILVFRQFDFRNTRIAKCIHTNILDTVRNLRIGQHESAVVTERTVVYNFQILSLTKINFQRPCQFARGKQFLRSIESTVTDSLQFFAEHDFAQALGSQESELFD